MSHHGFLMLENTDLSDNSAFDISLQALVGIPVRKYRIFMCMLPKEGRMYPLQVMVTASARVLDFIGLICYKYASEHPDHNLKFVASYLAPPMPRACLIHEVSAGRLLSGRTSRAMACTSPRTTARWIRPFPAWTRGKPSPNSSSLRWA